MCVGCLGLSVCVGGCVCVRWTWFVFPFVFCRCVCAGMYNFFCGFLFRVCMCVYLFLLLDGRVFCVWIVGCRLFYVLLVF